jgi:V/A-type H+-transporting ATPase subunit C
LLDARYAFISAYLKGVEAKVVTPDHVARMVKTSNLRDALEVIKDTDIGDYFEEVPIKTFDDLDEYLWQYLGQCISHLEAFKFLPGDVHELVRAYIVSYDVYNIKVTLQGILTGKRGHMIPLGIIHDYGLLDELSLAEDIDGIRELLIRCQLWEYASVLKEYEIDEELKSRLLTEAKLDGVYYNNLLIMTKGIKDGNVLAKVIGLIIDLTNLQIVCRAIIQEVGQEVAEFVINGGYIISTQLISELLTLKLGDVPRKLENTPYHSVAEEIAARYNKTQNITSIGEIIDKYRFILIKEILSPRVLSPLVIAWYLVLKELEVRNLRLILKAMFDNIPMEEIRQYLVL